MPRKERRIIFHNKKNIVNLHKKSRIKNLERGFAFWSNRDNNRAKPNLLYQKSVAYRKMNVCQDKKNMKRTN